MQVNDLEGALAEIIRLKRENNMLIEQRQFFKVNSDKYQKRAILMRKKYTELKSVLKEKHPKKPKDPSEYRLLYTQAKSSLKNKQSECEQLRSDLNTQKTRAANFQSEASSMRHSANEARKQVKKLTDRLLKLEDN